MNIRSVGAALFHTKRRTWSWWLLFALLRSRLKTATERKWNYYLRPYYADVKNAWSRTYAVIRLWKTWCLFKRIYNWTSAESLIFSLVIWRMFVGYAAHYWLQLMVNIMLGRTVWRLMLAAVLMSVGNIKYPLVIQDSIHRLEICLSVVIERHWQERIPTSAFEECPLNAAVGMDVRSIGRRKTAVRGGNFGTYIQDVTGGKGQTSGGCSLC